MTPSPHTDDMTERKEPMGYLDLAVKRAALPVNVGYDSTYGGCWFIDAESRNGVGSFIVRETSDAATRAYVQLRNKLEQQP